MSVRHIFFHDALQPNNSKLIGEFIEQENDASEIQYLFKFYYDVLTATDLRYIAFPGIDLWQKRAVFVQSRYTF